MWCKPIGPTSGGWLARGPLSRIVRRGVRPARPAESVLLMTRTAEESGQDLKEQVRAFWQSHPCGTRFTEGVELGSPEFFRRVEEFRYAKEGHILAAADFASAGGLKVLEIGCGLGTDGVQFARAGAHYTGVDLTEAAVDLARRNFEWRNLPGEFRTADAENLEFADDTFDVVYSHGVLHHTPDTARAVGEVHRVLKQIGRAHV